jgi:hypothetical protein
VPPQVAVSEKSAIILNDRTKEALYLIAVYLMMIFGMAAKVAFDHLTKGTPSEWRNVVIPLLVSPMIYDFVFKAVKGSNETVLMLIFGFQNGFFWQDIFGQLGTVAVNSHG